MKKKSIVKKAPKHSKQSAPKATPGTLAALREQKGMTTAEVAKGSGVCAATILAFEKGFPVTTTTIQAIAAFLKVKPVEVFNLWFNGLKAE